MKKGYNLLVLKALEFFIENPYEEIHLREFARKSNISVNSAQRFLNFFLTQGFIIEFKRANLRYFKANLDSIVFKHIKIAYLLKKLENSGLIKFLKSKFSNAIIFGSCAQGLDNSKSDIDLLCIGQGKNFQIYNYEKKLGREINIHVFNLAQWKKQKAENKAFYQEVISKGINLIGEMPVL